MYSQIAQNKRKTLLILGGFFVLIAVLTTLASAIYGRGIAVYVILGAAFYVIISYFSSSSIALAVNGAREIQKQDNPELWRIVENLAITDGLPMPKVYVIDDPALNAFATGRNPQHASVAITTGLLAVLDKKELEGVMAHELGHIQNYDIRVSLLAFALVSVISLMGDLFLRSSLFGSVRDDEDSGNAFAVLAIVAAVFGVVAASMLQMALSRQREYLADATGALTTRYPEGLASALEKIQAGGSTLRRQNSSTAHFFIANPLKKGFFSSLFSTHPPIEERIAKLRSMGGGL